MSGSGRLRFDDGDNGAVISVSRARATWPFFVDGCLDGLLVSFAGWTIFYQVALVGQFSMRWAGWPWIVVTAALMVFLGRREASRHTTAESDAVVPGRMGESAWRIRAVLAGLVAVAALVVGREVWGVWPAAAAIIVVLALQVRPWVRQKQSVAASPTGLAPAPGSQVFAALVSLGLGVLGLFLLRPDADDTFYVNRATWVATHGTAALNDTMFSPNTLPPAYAGGTPTHSIEALQGVLAAALGLQAPTLCYLVVGPMLCAMVGWTTWRLVRAWAPRREVLVFVVALVFLLASADSIVGNYSFGRIWQGKAVAYGILLPLVWLYLSRLARRSSRSDLLMLLVSGIAFVGLTTTSALLAPVVTGAALLAAWLLRSASLAVGALAFAVAPLIAGLAQVLGPAAIGGGGDNALTPPSAAFGLLFGSALPMVLLGVAAMVLTPRLVPGSTGVLLASGAVASMSALLPGIFELADAVTGAGAVAWRLVIGLPIWVLVGLLVALPPPTAVTATRSITLVAAAICVVWGTWQWSAEGAGLTSRPTWKVDQRALADVRELQRQAVPPGLWQMPTAQMEILAISTVEVHPVTARTYYLPTLRVPPSGVADRVVLLRLEAGEPVTARAVRVALRRLDVAVACVPGDVPRAVSTLRRAVRDDLRRVGTMRCHIGRVRR